MPGDKETIEQFAARIKAKYPQYKDVNDTDLVNRIVAKHPEYKERVDYGTITRQTQIAPPQYAQPAQAPIQDFGTYQLPSQRPATDSHIPQPHIQSAPEHFQTLQETHQREVTASNINLQKELQGADATIKSLLTKHKRQDEMAGIQNDLQNRGVDATANPNLLAHVQHLLPKASLQVSDDEIKNFKGQMETDPNLVRETLYEHAQLHPEKAKKIAADLYVLDSQHRGKNAEQILKNKKGIEEGNNEYSILSGGAVKKQQGFLESTQSGYDARTQQFNDYNLLSDGKDQDIINEFEKRRTTHPNEDTPVPEPKGIAGGFGQMVGAEGPTIAKGAVPSVLATLTGVGAAAAPWAGALLTSPDFYKRGYANSFGTNYNELRDQGHSPEDALKIAKNRASFDAKADVAMGAAMTLTGAKLGTSEVGAAKMSPGFLGAVKGAVKEMAASSPEAAGVGALGGLTQVAKNLHSGKKAGEGVAEAALVPIAFHFGIKSIAAGAKVVGGTLFKSSVDNMAKQPEEAVNKTIGEQVETGELAPEQANEVYNTIAEKRAQNQALTDKAKEIVAKGKVQGMEGEPLQNAALNNPEEFSSHLKVIADQAHDPKTAGHTAEVFGEDLVSVAKQLYPHEDTQDLIKANREQDLKEVDAEIKKLNNESADYGTKKKELDEQKKQINDYYDNYGKHHEEINAPQIENNETETNNEATTNQVEENKPTPFSNQQLEAAGGFLKQGIEDGSIPKEYEGMADHPEYLLNYIKEETKAGKEADMEKEFGKDLVALSKTEAHYPIVKNIKLKENAPTEQSAGTLDVGQPPVNGEEMGSGNSQPEGAPGEGQPENQSQNTGQEEGLDPYGLPFENGPEDKRTGIKNAISYATRFEQKLPKVEVPKLGSDTEVLAQGKELVDSGKINPHEVIDRILSTNEGMHPDEAKAMQYYMHQLGTHEENLRQQLADSKDELSKAYTNGQLQQLSDEIDAATEANIKGGKAWSDVGNIRQIVVDPAFNASREKSLIKEAYGGKLPPGVQEKIDAVIKQRDSAIDARIKAEERLKNAAATKTIQKIKEVVEKAEKETKAKKATKEDILKERQNIIEEIKQAWKEDRSQLGSLPLPAHTVAAIGKLAINYFKEGYVNLEELTEKIFEDVKAHITGITKRDVRDAISQYDPLRDVAKGTAKDKLAAKEKRIANQLATGKIIPPIKNPSLNFTKDTEWHQANQKVIDAEYKLKTEKRKAFESKKNMYQKGLMWAGRGFRLSVLSGYNVLGKLAAAATIGGAAKRIPEQAIGSIYNQVFKGIAKKAPIEGAPNLSAELKFYKEFFDPKKFAKNSLEILKSGASPLSKQFGGGEHEHIPGLYLPTDLHQIIKDPLKRGTFEASFKNAMSWADKQGLDITDPLVIQSMETAAYKRAQYEIFQESNKVSRAFSKFKTDMEKKGNVGATGKFLADFLIPVSTVPTNIVRRVTTTSPLGLIRGGAQVIEAYRKGIENLSNEQADAVMRQLKQGSLGTALWLVGWFGASHFGGLYSKFNPDKKRMEGELPSDEMEVNGKMIPKPVQHALPLEIIQLAATMKHIHDNYVDRKGEGEFSADLHAGLGSIGALAEQIPVVETGVNAVLATKEPYYSGKLEADVKRRFKPQILRETGIIKKDTSATKTAAKKSGHKKEHRK